MTEQKKSALTAGTVIDANETYQKQNTTDSGGKQELVELFKLLATAENEVYERGRNGKEYHADWVKKWKAHFGSEPDPKMRLILELTDQLMTKSYEKGRSLAKKV